jgi:methylmalonyl-CoA/ethylmalonyl-CoA epimerase
MLIPKVTSETTLSNSFLGSTKQVCVVSRDIYRTMDGLIKLGIGPWRVYTFSPETCTDVIYRSKPSTHSMRLSLATSGDMLWEVIQPLEGPSIYTEFLDQHGEGIHHVAPLCEGLTYDQQVSKFESLGYRSIQSGTWQGVVPFSYFETEGDISTTLEIFDIPEDYDLPEPEEWYPAAPPEAA